MSTTTSSARPVSTARRAGARVRTQAGGVAAALALLVVTASQAQAPQARTTAAGGLDCMIQPAQIVQVGSPVAGVIDSVAVDRGERVTRGQVLAQLGAQVERAALAMARERADQSGEVLTAGGSADLAQRELQRANELHGQEFVSRAYLDKIRAEATVAGGRSTQAEERKRVASRELALAAAQLNQRTIRSPIDGVVVDRYLSPGEFVEQKPILRLASIDPLRVDVLVPAAAFGRVQPGDAGTVVPDLLDRSPHTATVKTVDRVIDAASNTFRVRLELPNPGHKLPAGLRCKLNFGDAVMAGLATTPARAAPAQQAAPTGGTGAAVPARAAVPVASR